MALILQRTHPNLQVGASLNYGNYMIYGTVKNTGLPDFPVYRRLRLHLSQSGAVIDDVFSDPITGDYQFRYLKYGSYYVVSFDHTGQYNGVIATDIYPIPMP
jgi:hypothetical protein